MFGLDFRQAAQVMGARTWGRDLGRQADRPLPRVVIDSRQVKPGDCFFAIKGDRLDGHDFLEAAMERGAALGVCSRTPDLDAGAFEDRIILRVADTTRALQELAAELRRRWGRSLVGVTGSMGKTTTRTFTARLLESGHQVLQSPANFNNAFGVPLSLLRLEERHDLAVLELGMNHAGEIRRLARICRPDLAVITNVAPVHLEFFSSVDEIARAKGEILEDMPAAGVFVYNADDHRVAGLASAFHGRRVSFSLERNADVQVTDVRVVDSSSTRFILRAGWGESSCRVAFVGRHHLYNLAAAVAAARTLGLSREQIEGAIPSLSPLPMRGKIRGLEMSGSRRIRILDDSYNSNPQAVRMALETVGQSAGAGRRILALGEMLELGPESAVWHRRVGRMAARIEPHLLAAVGAGARPFLEGAREAGLADGRTLYFGTSEEAAEYLCGFICSGDFLLIKGSRGVGMERIAALLEEGKGA